MRPHKQRITLGPGDRVYFVSEGKALISCPYLELVKVWIEDEPESNVHWTLKGSFELSGRAKQDTPLPLFKDSWVALNVPVVIHCKTNGLAPEFIFCLPTHVKAQRQP